MAIISASVTDREAVRVENVPDPVGDTVIFRLSVSERDLGKVIGKAGRFAQSIRIILYAIAQQNSEKFRLDIVGTKPSEMNEGHGDCIVRVVD